MGWAARPRDDAGATGASLVQAATVDTARGVLGLAPVLKKMLMITREIDAPD
jgi:hypothetical protein